MKKLMSLFLSVIMLFSVTAGVDFSSFADDEGAIIPGDHEHIYNEFITKQPTCTEEGIKYLWCTGCDREKTETIPATGHNFVSDEKYCTYGCGTENPNYSEGQTHTHVWSGETIVYDSTCTAEGLKKYTCTECGETKAETISATGHKIVVDKAVPATCTKTGLTQGSHCSVCGEVFVAQKTVAKTAHKYDSGKITKKATCTASGIKTYTCTVCKAVKTETIKATGHKPVKDKAVKATYVKTGKTEGSHCSVCKKVIKAQKTVAKLKLAKPSSVKISAVSKGFKISWKKAKDASGYQIQYSTSSKFKSAKTVTVNSKTTSKTIKKLKAKKKYYVRIRTYKTVKVNGKNKKVYSAWVTKNVKTKK